MARDVGLALSGGGSRAAAFHRGTLRAIHELGLDDRVQTISSVSGGSVFAASWMAARARGQNDDTFLGWFRDVLERGFVRPALLNWRIVKLLWPGFTRTHRLAETFDEILFDDTSIDDLPESPCLCLNTTVMNNASTGRFSRDGYSGKDVGDPIGHEYPVGPVEGVTLGCATAASAAFPFALPPLAIRRDHFAHPLRGDLEKEARLHLTDGGILENTGIERLLQEGRFKTKHIVVSDAGVRTATWRPTLGGRLRSALAFALSSQLLDRLLNIMNDKQNRSMRQLLYEELVERPPHLRDRSLLFTRLEDDWTKLIRNIPCWRLTELGVTRSADVESVVDLTTAKQIYSEMGGAVGFGRANNVPTGFCGLSSETLDILETHARWQLHATAAIYGRP